VDVKAYMAGKKVKKSVMLERDGPAANILIFCFIESADIV